MFAKNAKVLGLGSVTEGRKTVDVFSAAMELIPTTTDGVVVPLVRLGFLGADGRWKWLAGTPQEFAALVDRLCAGSSTIGSFRLGQHVTTA